MRIREQVKKYANSRKEADKIIHITSYYIYIYIQCHNHIIIVPNFMKLPKIPWRLPFLRLLFFSSLRESCISVEPQPEAFASHRSGNNAGETTRITTDTANHNGLSLDKYVYLFIHIYIYTYIYIYIHNHNKQRPEFMERFDASREGDRSGSWARNQNRSLFQQPKRRRRRP